MSKFMKTLFIINGLILPLIIGVIIFQIIESVWPERNVDNEGIIVGERMEEEKLDSMVLQGLIYYSPKEVYNSSNYYLPIYVTSYTEPRDLRKMSKISFNYNNSNDLIINVVFMNKDYQVIGSLLDKKASIARMEIPDENIYGTKVDKTVKNIVYLIGFEDTNADGKLNSLDKHDLYITDLDGKNLVKATNNIDVELFEFIKSHSQILIQYKERSNIREEHKKPKFGLFDIQTSVFKPLNGLNHTIDKIEGQLTK